ncbi:MAG: hypothetical protein SF070_15925 [Gemmatimonadota bacterium]|nr:hypothetical protein [Gemmatimonadota bacterium]
MLRSSRFRAVGLVCFLAAGSSDPAWELAHALEHQHALAEPGHQAHPAESPDALALVAADHHHDHGHPVLDAGLRPVRDLTTPAVLAPTVPAATLAAGDVIAEVFATASPPPPRQIRSRSSSPRAPPLR